MENHRPNWKPAITLLRILIGWHFLYEGIVKLYNPDWTALGYLATAEGPLAPFFHVLSREGVIGWMDTFNTIALVFVGITLLLGVFEKWGAAVGMILLAFYYLAHPPLPGFAQLNVEGSYWIVNKNLIELVACWVLFILPTGHYFGLNRIVKKQSLTTETL